MKTEKITFRLKGLAPLLVHNPQLSDPLNYWTKKIKAISSKRKKVEADHEEMAHLEFLGSLYLDDKKRICIPTRFVEAALINAAKKSRMGKTYKSVVFTNQDYFPIEYEGPQDPEKLWAEEKYRNQVSLVVQGNRVVRTRPMFTDWAVTVDVYYITEMEVDEKDIIETMKLAGTISGFGDGRPRFGRFSVEVL